MVEFSSYCWRIKCLSSLPFLYCSCSLFGYLRSWDPNRNCSIHVCVIHWPSSVGYHVGCSDIFKSFINSFMSFCGFPMKLKLLRYCMLASMAMLDWRMWLCSYIMLLCSYEWNSFHVSKNLWSWIIVKNYSTNLYRTWLRYVVIGRCDPRGHYLKSWKFVMEKNKKKLKFYRNPILSGLFLFSPWHYYFGDLVPLTLNVWSRIIGEG